MGSAAALKAQGIDAFQQQDAKGALGLWQAALEVLAPNPDNAELRLSLMLNMSLAALQIEESAAARVWATKAIEEVQGAFVNPAAVDIRSLVKAYSRRGMHGLQKRGGLAPSACRLARRCAASVIRQ